MTLRPCLDCGVAAEGPRCNEHTTDHKPTAHTRGYNAAWTRLSKRARRMQPFCECGAVEDLQLDHLPSAWERQAQGKPIRLGIDAVVRCGPCNRAAGAARGENVTRER